MEDEVRKTCDCRILVVGDAMIDRYVYGKMERISDEAPVPVVEYEKEEYRLGGAANVAAHIAGLGAGACMCGLCGDDENALILRDCLKKAGVECDLLVEDPERPTILKMRVMVGKHQVFRMDYEKRSDVGVEMERRILDRIEERLDDFHLVVLADYGKGLLTGKVASGIIRMAGMRGIKVISSARAGTPIRYGQSYLVKINAKDLGRLAGMEIHGDKDRVIAMQKIKSLLKVDNVVVVKKDESIIVLDSGFKVHDFEPLQEKTSDVIGVGATVMAVLGVYIMKGASVEEAARKANLGASLKMEKLGAGVVRLEEIEKLERAMR